MNDTVASRLRQYEDTFDDSATKPDAMPLRVGERKQDADGNNNNEPIAVNDTNTADLAVAETVTESPEAQFQEWRNQFFLRERQYRSLYYKGGSREDFVAVFQTLNRLKQVGEQREIPALYCAYCIILDEFVSDCQKSIETNSFGPVGTNEEAVGELSAERPQLSYEDAERDPCFVDWKNKFFELEKTYHDLLTRGGTREEFEAIQQEFRLRVIWTDTVEDAVGFAPLKVYFCLIQLYVKMINIEIFRIVRLPTTVHVAPSSTCCMIL